MDLFFISYAKKDGETFARAVRSAIQKAGIPAWLDDEDISTGEEWWNVINGAIRASIGMIVIITPGALESHYVCFEYATARALGKAVVPLLFFDVGNETKATHPIFTMQYRDFTAASKQDWQSLIEYLREIQNQKRVHPTVGEAEKTLYSPKPEEWSGAINTLEHFEHPSAVEALARQVNSSNPEVSKLAGLALARKSSFQDARAVPGLAKAAADRDPSRDNRRNEAIGALGAIGSPEAAQELLALLESLRVQDRDYPHQVRIVEALGRSGDAAAVPTLVSLVTAPVMNINVRQAAIRALGRIGNAEAVSHLIEFLQAPPSIPDKPLIAEALGQTRSTEAVPYLSKQLQSLVVNTPGDASRYGSNNIRDGVAIAKAMGEIGGESALEELEEALQAVREPNIRNAIKAAIESATRG